MTTGTNLCFLLMAKLQIQVITQEQLLTEMAAESITLPASEGEITVLPGHLPLFSKLKPGNVIIRDDAESHVLAVWGGFVDIAADRVVIMADTAVRAEEIDESKAEAARRKAEELMKKNLSKVEFLQAEASLRKALLELKTVKRWKKARQR